MFIRKKGENSIRRKNEKTISRTNTKQLIFIYLKNTSLKNILCLS